MFALMSVALVSDLMALVVVKSSNYGGFSKCKGIPESDFNLLL